MNPGFLIAAMACASTAVLCVWWGVCWAAVQHGIVWANAAAVVLLLRVNRA